MQKTLIIYENMKEVTEKIVNKMALILGPCKCCSTLDFKEDYKNYDFFVIVSSVHEENFSEDILSFVKENASWLINRPVALLCSGIEGDKGIRALKKVQSILGSAVVHCKCINNQHSNEIIVQFSLELKRIRDSFIKAMPRELLKGHIDEFLQNHKCCDLATGYNNWIRTTPVEYIYINGNMYILSEGGKKFANILLNDRVSVSIYEDFGGMDKLQGMQIRGRASIVDLSSIEYEDVINEKGLSKENIKNLPATLYCIKVEFEKIEFLYSKFNTLGYDIKQIYYYENF